MNYNELPNIDDLNTITGYSEIIDPTTGDIVYQHYSYYHIPILVLFFISLIFIWFANRILIEFLIRWRK